MGEMKSFSSDQNDRRSNQFATRTVFCFLLQTFENKFFDAHGPFQCPVLPAERGTLLALTIPVPADTSSFIKEKRKWRKEPEGQEWWRRKKGPRSGMAARGR
jgi:hypothetical protein